MCKALAEIMKPELDEAFDNGFNNGIDNGFNNGKRDILITTAKNFLQNGVSYEVVRKSIQGLSDEELRAIYEEACA